MKRLLRYLRQSLTQTILAPLFKMLEAVFELFVPLVVADMIDNSHLGTQYLLTRGGLLLALGVIGLASAVTAQYFAARAAARTGTLMRSDLFRHCTALSYTQMDQTGISTLIQRMTGDINQVQTGVNMFLRLFLRSPFVVAGAMVMAFTVNTKAALIFVAVIAALFAVVGLLTKLTMPLYKQNQSRLDAVLRAGREHLTGVRVVRAFAREEEERDSFAQKGEVLFAGQRKAGHLSALLGPLTYVIINLATVAVLQVGAVQIDTGILTMGEVIALVNYMSQILIELVKFSNLIITLSRGMASLSRVNDIFALEPPQTAGQSACAASCDAPAVELRNVSFSYHGEGKEALRNVSFSLRRGQTLGVIGTTGSGKTTLIQLIPAFYPAGSGQVLIDGIRAEEWDSTALHQKIGIVPQKAQLFSGSIRSNLLWGDETADDAALWQALETAQAADFVRRKDGGLDYELEANGANLSGGQKQRLCIARALVRNPEILILDDAACALDYATDAKLRKALKSCTQQTAVILVSQRIATVRGADQILLLEDGEVAGLGTHEQLLHSNEAYRELCALQLGEEALG